MSSLHFHFHSHTKLMVVEVCVIRRTWNWARLTLTRILNSILRVSKYKYVENAKDKGNG